MSKFIKYGLWLAITLTLTMAGVMAYLAATFDPNDYKAQIIQRVKDKKQRSLKLDGDIKLTFFPGLGLNLGRVFLSEFQSDKEFISISSARVSLALIPLLSERLVVDEVALKDLKLTLVEYKNAATNYDDLLAKEETPQSDNPTLHFDIASIQLENSEINFLDETTGVHYAAKEINLHTGRVANNVPGNIELSARIQANSKPHLDLALKLKSALTFDLEQQSYQMKNMELQADGLAYGINNLAIKASGNASANLTTREFTAKELMATANGIYQRNNFSATLDVPGLNMTKEKFSGDKLTVNVKAGGAMAWNAFFTLSDMTGDAQFFNSSALMELQMDNAGQHYQARLASPLSGNFEQQQLNFSNLVVAVTVSGDNLPDKSISSEMKGSLQLDGRRQSMLLHLAGGLLQSQVKARVGVNNYTRPVIRFDIEADQFDADAYLPKETPQPGTSASANTVEQSWDMTTLKTLNLQGSLRIGALKAASIKLAKVRVDLNARDGQLNIDPLSAQLYQGSMQGTLSVTQAAHRRAMPVFALEQKLQGVNIAPLLKDLADVELLEGKGHVTASLKASGNAISALKSTLAGKVTMNLTDGAVRGFNLTERIRDVQAWGKGGEAAPAKSVNNQEKTEFSEFKASFNIRNGIAHNEDLSVKSQFLRMTGAGDINLNTGSIDYLTKATLSKTLDGKGGSVMVPVHLSGSFDAIEYRLDRDAMVSDIVKKKIEAKEAQIKEQVQEKLKSKLKELLK